MRQSDRRSSGPSADGSGVPVTWRMPEGKTLAESISSDPIPCFGCPGRVAVNGVNSNRVAHETEIWT